MIGVIKVERIGTMEEVTKVGEVVSEKGTFTDWLFEQLEIVKAVEY